MDKPLKISRRILWVDDDGPERFLYEDRKLRELGWEVHWELSASEASRRLRQEAFSVVLLDQTLPWQRPRPGKIEAVWAGCLLLHWLRGKGRPEKAPPMKEFDDGLFPDPPKPENLTSLVILVSAFYDPEVNQALHDLEPNLLEVPKPIDFRDLRHYLSGR